MSKKYSTANVFEECPYVVKRISEETYSIAENDEFNWRPLLYFISTPEKALLIDTGCGTGDLKTFLNSSGLLGVSQKLIVVNTHNHPQQTGCAYLFSTTGNFGLSHNVECLCASGANINYTELHDTNFDWQVRTYKVTKWLSHNEKLLLAGQDSKVRTVQIFHTPGHTPDSLTLWYENDKRLFVGDLFYRYEDILMTYRMSSIKELEKSVRLLISFITDFEKLHKCAVAFKNYHRFLLSVIAGTHYKLPLHIPYLRVIKFETRNKDMRFIISNDMNSELIEARGKAQNSLQMSLI